jgi:hypothetical protein
VRQLRLSDRVLRDSAELPRWGDVLAVEQWASGWLGRAWRDARLGDRDALHRLCLEVAGRASSRPSPAGLAAVAALRRVAPASVHALLDGTIKLLAESQPSPPWRETPGFTAVRAWRAVDVRDSERVLFVEYAAPDDASTAHTLTAEVVTVSGRMIDRLALLRAGAAESWEELREPGEPPMPLTGAPVEDVLAEMADVLRDTDMIWPRPDDEGFVELRSLAWTRCAPYQPDWPEIEPLPSAERQRRSTP